MFNFKRLVKKYSKNPVYLIRELDGYYDYENGGKWIDGKQEKIKIEVGALVPLSNEDFKYDENGSYNYEDRKLYCYDEIKKGEKIECKELIYTVHEKKPYSDFDIGLNIYFVKRVDNK